MPSYLISWKPATENEERGWPVAELIALSERLRQTGAAQERWRFRRRDGVKVGERVFVVRQGRAGHAIIGYGKVAEIPKRNDGYTAVSFDILLNPTSSSVLATEDELHAITTKRGVWNTMASGIALSSDVASRLESLVVNREPIPDAGKPTEPTGARWNLDELRAAVQSYLEMQRAVRAGKELNKKAIYRDLSHRFGRTEKAYEYRMQNISYVLSLQGRTWIPGLVPARNVGTSVAGDIEMILAELEGRTVNRDQRQLS